MGKLLDRYQNKVEALESLYAKESKGEVSENMLMFMRMMMEAAKGQIQLYLVEEMGPMLTNKAMERCDPGFTFEQFLAEADRIFGDD